MSWVDPVARSCNHARHKETRSFSTCVLKLQLQTPMGTSGEPGGHKDE